MLKNKKGSRRAYAEVLVLLPEWGVEARPLAPLLRELAADENGDQQVIMTAAVSLVLMAADDDHAGVNTIRKVVQNPVEVGRRKFLLEIAAQLGTLAKPLAPELRPLAADAVVGELAKEVLAKIDSVKE